MTEDNSGYLFQPLTAAELATLKGIISGDGDIGGRMASSYPQARDPISPERRKMLNDLAQRHLKRDTPWEELDRFHPIKTDR